MNERLWVVLVGVLVSVSITFLILHGVPWVLRLRGRWQARRKVAKALRYVAPELYAERKYELEVVYGLRPAPIGGSAEPMFIPGTTAGTDTNCPHCGKPIMVLLVPPPPPDKTFDVALGPDESGAHQQPPPEGLA